MTATLLTALLLGLSAGVSPGPLLTLVIAQSLRHGRLEGMKVALAPLLTDLPILALALGLYSQLPKLDAILGAVSLVGAAFVAWLALQSLRPAAPELDLEAEPPRSILKGVLVNLLSPHPYIFWFGLGAPAMLKAGSEDGIRAMAAFPLMFLLVISGSKMLIAELVGRSRGFLKGRIYAALMKVLGLALLVFAALLVRDGLRLLAASPA